MEKMLDKEKFAKYFFFGLENKDQVIKWVIVDTAKRIVGTHIKADDKNGKMNYEIDEEKILELIVQLERFTTLHDDPQNRNYFYDSINTNSINVHQLFNKVASQIEKHFAISFVKYRPVSGIYFNTYGYSKEIREKYKKYSGEQYLQALKDEPSSAWGEEVLEILQYLKELEQENKFEYYSLFLDSKYARAINRNRKRNNR